MAVTIGKKTIEEVETKEKVETEQNGCDDGCDIKTESPSKDSVIENKFMYKGNCFVAKTTMHVDESTRKMSFDRQFFKIVDGEEVQIQDESVAV